MAGEKPLVQSKKKCNQRCLEHIFHIQPRIVSKCWLKQETKVDFCPLYNEQATKFENIIPIFNNDAQSCLPGFILEVDKNDYQNSIKKYQDDHDRKIQDYTMKRTQLQIPKPGRKHRYCGVCRKPYVDYLDHIKSHDHIHCFNKHEFIGVINKIIDENYRSDAINDSNTYPKVQEPVKKKRGRKPNSEKAAAKQAKIIENQQQEPIIYQPAQYFKPPVIYYPLFSFLIQPGQSNRYIYQDCFTPQLYNPQRNDQLPITMTNMQQPTNQNQSDN